MRETLLEWLACPADGHGLALTELKRTDKDVITGELTCQHCGNIWPIRGGIPRFQERGNAEQVWRATEISGGEWHKAVSVEPQHRKQFEECLAPFRLQSFGERFVLDVGSGRGIYTAIIHDSGARVVVSFDVNENVEVAYETNRRRARCHFLQADIESLPLKPIFDVVVSVGLLHHLESPEQAARVLGSLLAPGGRAIFWLSSRENNEWVARFAEPLRRRLARLPQPVWKLAAFWIALFLSTFGRVVYGGFWGRSLPHADRWRYLVGLPFGELRSMVEDRLAAPDKRYLTKQEAENLIVKAGLELETIRHHEEKSWTVIGRRPSVRATRPDLVRPKGAST